jgi:hypothetical protein
MLTAYVCFDVNTNFQEPGMQWATQDETFRDFTFSCLKKAGQDPEFQAGLVGYFIEHMKPDSRMCVETNYFRA